MGDDGTGAVDAAADELYGLALDQFLPRRTELAKAARAAGDKSAATEIGALRKPTVPAWLMNLLAREAADDLGALLELGEQLREAQSQLLGPRIKELSQQAHAAVSGLSRRASEIAESRGQSVTAAADRDIEQTLRAALADPQAELAVASGRLTRALAYAGFGEVDVTAATSTPLGRTTARPVARSRGAEGDQAAGPEEAAAPGAAEREESAQPAVAGAGDKDSGDRAASAQAGEPTTTRLTSVGGRSAGKSRAGSARAGSKATAGDRGASAQADREQAARARAEAARAEDAAARAEHEQAVAAAEAAARAAREAEALVGELQERLAQARRDAADAVRAEETAWRAEQRAARAAREAAAALRMATRAEQA
jgi:hypothetical protein